MTDDDLKRAIEGFLRERDAYLEEREAFRRERADFQNENRDFEKSKLTYEQNSEMFRSLNQLMWQVPILATTLNGGLWLAVGTMNISDLLKQVTLLFTAVADTRFIILLLRLRYIIDQYLNKLKGFSPNDFVAANGDGEPWHSQGHVVVSVFACILGMAAAISFAGWLYLLILGNF